MKAIEKKYYLPFALISVLFLLWGLANNMTDTLLAAFKKIMSMSDTQTSLIQFAFYGAYFCFAIPAALFIRRYTFKSGVILGLALYAWGAMLFYPAASPRELCVLSRRHICPWPEAVRCWKRPPILTL